MWAYRARDENWRRIYELFKDFWFVLHQKTHPKHTSTFYNRIQLTVLWNYPDEELRRLSTRLIWHAFIWIQINVFFLTLLFALPESVDNIVDLGQDILWMIGTFHMLFKWHFFYFYIDDIDEVINDLDACHCEPKSGPAVAIIRSEQRWFFLMESAQGLAWHVGIILFCVLVVLQPLLTGQKLPFHTVCPFHWHDPSQHPISHVCIYIWQCVFLFYNMACILYTDLFSSHCFAQLAVNLKILFVDRTNEVFYSPLIMQILTAFLMISVSTFEALVARHEPAVAVRFVIFMVLSFFHLFCWCLFGDMVSEPFN
ncbi:putative odorant receptor 65b [Drosophila virilis]|uniref:putative odorant receptor 65b n=1 Tax=Drosophila virilis TaxID=7244 RepID=UPI0038B4166A